MVGRTVKNVTNHTSILGGSDVEFTDGSIDYLSQWYNPKPRAGWTEELDSNRVRIGWRDNYGNWQNDYDYLSKSTTITTTGGAGTITLPSGSSGSTIWIGAGGGGGAGGAGSVGTYTWVDPVPEVIIVKCSKCKEEYDQHEGETYSWNPADERCTRNICRKCCTKALDKLYELDRSVETEEILYGKKNE